MGIAFVGFTENDPIKTILDVDGSLVYLPKRDNIRLATRVSVARSIRRMIIQRRNKATLTGLGHFTNFVSRYLPRFGDWLLWMNRKRIQEQFTMIGGEKVKKKSLEKGELREVEALSEVEV